MKIKLNSVYVPDQEIALKFYTEVLGFQKKMDIPVGDFRWLTVVSPEEPDGTELLLEPNGNPAATVYQAAIYESGIPLTSFAVSDVGAEYDRLKALGVIFPNPPFDAGGTMVAIFDDTCGNWIQIYEA